MRCTALFHAQMSVVEFVGRNKLLAVKAALHKIRF